MSEQFIDNAFELDPKAEPHRFSILLCIDGSQESSRALKYAVRLGQGNDADITLLYVRRHDKGMKSGVHLARQNMLDWGIELPGMRALKDARDQLVELGFLGGNWHEEKVRKRAYGDPLGDSMKTYTDEKGSHIALKLMVAPSVASGILDECVLNQYDLTIIAMSGKGGRNVEGNINWRVTKTVVNEHTGSILLAREIKASHGHLICVSDDKSIEAAKKDAVLTSRCNCPIHLFSVAPTKDDLPLAKASIEKARKAVKSVGGKVASAETAIGDPAKTIIEHGKDFSVIVMADNSAQGLRRLFKPGVTSNVLKHAHNSVMIIR